MPRRNRHRKGKKGRKRVQRRKYAKPQALTIRSPGAIMPDHLFTKMMYVNTFTTPLGNSTSQFGFVRWRANGLQDPDPLLLSGSVPGFNEFAAFYRFYRVRACKATVTVINQEVFGSVVMLFPTNYDVATSLSTGFLNDMIANTYCRHRIISSKGGMDRITLKNYITTTKISGSSTSKFDDNFASLILTIPTKLWYMNLACYTLAGENYTSAGLPYEIKLTYYVEWYDRNTLAPNA